MTPAEQDSDNWKHEAPKSHNMICWQEKNKYYNLDLFPVPCPLYISKKYKFI